MTTCPRCTRDVATAADWAHPDGCECDRCLSVCYGADGCAIAAARLPDEVVRLRAELATAARLRDEELRGYTEAQHALNLIAIAVGAESGPGAADIEGAERRRWADAVRRVQAMARTLLQHGKAIEGDEACAAELWQANVEPLIEAVLTCHRAHGSMGRMLAALDDLKATTAKEGK